MKPEALVTLLCCWSDGNGSMRRGGGTRESGGILTQDPCSYWWRCLEGASGLQCRLRSLLVGCSP